MKGLGARVNKGLQVGSRIVCNDNSGAKIVQIIGTRGAKASKAMYPKVGVGDIVIVSVKKGSQQMRKKVLKALVVRQKQIYRRPNGMRIMFEDNAVVIIDDAGLPVGTEIKGCVSREVADRYPKVAAIAPAVV